MMKRPQVLGLLVFALLFSVTATAATEKLVCRGGGGTLGLSTHDNSAVFYFPRSADTSLLPGECALVNGTFSEAGPHSCIKQTGVRATAWLFPKGNKAAYISGNPNPWMRKLLSRNHFQYFDIIRGGSGCFTITRVY